MESRGADKADAAARLLGRQVPSDQLHGLQSCPALVLIQCAFANQEGNWPRRIELLAKENFLRHGKALQDMRVSTRPAQSIGSARRPTFDRDAAHNKVLSKKRFAPRF
jgi:hypothetical protein